MAQLKCTVRKTPHTNLLPENFQTFLIQHDLLPQSISNEAQIIHLDTTSNTTTSAPIYELGKQLLDAAKNGNISEIKSLMRRGAAFTPDWLGACPLHYAASNGHVQACEVLLRAGISRNSRTKVDRTPLHMAVYAGHIDVVESLIKHGADVNARDMLLMTPLQWAVQRCRTPANNNDGNNDSVSIAMVEYLLTHGAKATTENKFGNTALDIAKQLENVSLVELIQKAGIDQAGEADEALVQQQRIDQADEQQLLEQVDNRVSQKEVNEYLNDCLRLSTTETVNYQEQQEQNQVVTIEDCIDEDEDEAQEDMVNDIVPMLIDNGYCSSTSVDQQQLTGHNEAALETTVTHNIDLTVDESTTSASIVDVDTVVVDQDQHNHPAAVVDPYRMLRQRFGIELLPEAEEDGGRILKQAMDSGHSVSLTEAGKRALKAFKLQDHQNSVEQVDVVDDKHQQVSTTKHLNEPIPLLQLVNKHTNNSTKKTPSMPLKVQQIAVNQMTSNIINTSKRKRIFTNASANSSVKRTPQIVLLQNTNTNNTRIKATEGLFKIGSTRQMHELVPTPTTKAPSMDFDAESGVGPSHPTVHPNKQIHPNSHQQQQETTLFTLTTDEFAGLQANGGLITTNNGVYRLMDYNHSPVTNATPVNVVKQKRSRGGVSNDVLVGVGNGGSVIKQTLFNRQQRQQESETVRVLRQQLQEQRHLVDVFKRKCLKKEAEAERFKQQLKLMLKHRSSNKNINTDVIYNNDETNSR